MANVSVPAKYRRLLRAATGQAGIPYEVGAEQITVESDFQPDVVSPAGAEGIAQFMPGTWSQYGHGSPFNPRDAFPAYGRFMGDLMNQEGGSLRDALAAYNAGPGDVQAGYPYADKILAASGEQQVPYANPLRDVQGLTPERIDMGVDYGGSGPIYALGPGEITNVYNSGWPGGAFIGEKLTAGPLAGHYVYAAEDITPDVQVGQKVDARTQIGELTGGGIETGFAEPPGTGFALGRTQFSGSNTTAYGQAYSDLLRELGAPGGVPQNQPPTGQLPGWLKNVGKGLHGTNPGGGGWHFNWGEFPIIGPILQGGADTAHGLAAIAAVLEKFEHMVEWWAMPSNWFRIFAGVAGTGLVVIGVTSLARPRVNLPVLGSTPVVPAGELGPAFGIASVTGGAILLFFAFHNTGVGSWPELLNAVRDRVHGQPVPVQS